jgi:hypothetical protein
MAGEGGSRAFAGTPQPVEIHHRGIWYSGELLGWRNEPDGRVVARVRCVVDRLRHSAWKDLSDLRLPDPADPPRRAVPPSARPGPAPTDEVDATRPHVLLAELRTRPRTPAHVRTPPARRTEQPVRPRWEPAEPLPRRTTPVRQRTADHPERRKVDLSRV